MKRSNTDRAWLALLAGVQATLHIALVWVPALLTVVLSLFAWDNLAPLSAIEWVGKLNYQWIFTIYREDFAAALFNNVVLIVWLAICSAIGMLLAARLSVDLGLAPAGDGDRLAALLGRLGLPLALPAGDPARLLEPMRLDKKNLGGRLRLVLWRGIGHAEVFAGLPGAAVRRVLG